MAVQIASAKVSAPWTEGQVKRLNAWQHRQGVHPFTCGSGNRTDEHHKDREGVLVATKRGWVCPFCNYTQDWAWDFMVDPNS